jgi:hypothetical protein
VHLGIPLQHGAASARSGRRCVQAARGTGRRPDGAMGLLAQRYASKPRTEYQKLYPTSNSASVGCLVSHLPSC